MGNGLITHKAYLKSSNISENDRFGTSVAIDGDTLVVGAFGEDSSTRSILPGSELYATDDDAADSGAVYVYKRSGETWTQEAYLKAPNCSAGDYFGISVAISGDTIVVGARNEDSSTGSIINGTDLSTTDDNLSKSGAAYVFARSGSAWLPQAYLKAPNPSASDEFGYAVAIDGDTVVVGARYEDSSTDVIIHGSDLSGIDGGANESGAVYVFTRSGTTWTHQAYIKSPLNHNGDQFGWSAVISGDTLAVSEPEDDSTTKEIINGSDLSSADNSGYGRDAVHVFTRIGGIWSYQSYLKAPNNEYNNVYFGMGLALSGDRILVGTYAERSNTSSIIHGSDLSDVSDDGDRYGAAYLFTRNGTNWSHYAYLKAPNVDSDDYFGASGFPENTIAISGSTMVVSAQLEDSSTNGIIHGDDLSDTNNGDGDMNDNYGAVYVFR